MRKVIEIDLKDQRSKLKCIDVAVTALNGEGVEGRDSPFRVLLF